MILCIFMSVGVFSLTFVILQFFLFYLSLTKGLSILFIFLENSFLLIFSIILLVCFFYFGCDLYYCLPSANCRLNLFFSSLLCYSYIVCDLKIFIYFLPFFFFFFFRATPMAYEVSQARGPIRTTAASLRHSHSNVGS